MNQTSDQPFDQMMLDQARIDNAFAVSYEFPVLFTGNTFGPANPSLNQVLAGTAAKPVRCVVAIDSGVLPGQPDLPTAIESRFEHDPTLDLVAAPQIVDGGEASKESLQVVERFGKIAREVGLCRHSAIIVIGGGAVVDAVGLAAALIHRGIRLIRLPTTTLGQADAGLGVKNAINAFQAKNFFGTFVPPHAVINDRDFLPQLPMRQWRCGLAEAIKVALIKDPDFFRELVAAGPKLAERDESVMAWAIKESARLHLTHICGNGDPFERGTSRPLDFGHWSAHWLEMHTEALGEVLHGEAVAIGMHLDARYAVSQGWLDEADSQALATFLATIGLPLDHPVMHRGIEDLATWELLAGLEEFRQHLGGELTLAMPDGLGKVQDCTAIDAEKLRSIVING